MIRARPVAFAPLLRSPAFARAYALAGLGAASAGFAIERVAGVVTAATITVGLAAIGIAMLALRRPALSPLRIAPTSLLAFLVWCLATVFWSHDRAGSLVSWAGLAAVTIIGIAIAHTRDTLQTVRAFGDVLRWLLSISLGVEILSGALIDTPISVLGVEGNLARLGPAQGIFGTSEVLGLCSVLAVLVFAVEWRTASVRPGVAVFSAALAVVNGVLSASPITLALACALLLAALVLTAVRRTPPTRRGALQWALGGVVVVGAGFAWAGRHQLVAAIGAGTALETRTELWRALLDDIERSPILGWGWYGEWEGSELPFRALNLALGPHTSASNAYLDVLLQTGMPGLFLFLAVAGIALVRSWMDAGSRRSVVFAWTPLTLVVLLTVSLVDSVALTGAGWLLLVLCAVRAGQARSWRELLAPPEEEEPTSASAH